MSKMRMRVIEAVPLRNPRSTRRTTALVVLAFALAAGALSGCASKSAGGTSSASCAAVMVYRGHTYWGRGGVLRDPSTTGRLVLAVVPPCGGSGGQLPAEPAPPGRVAAPAAIPPPTAFPFQGAAPPRPRRQPPTTTPAAFQ